MTINETIAEVLRLDEEPEESAWDLIEQHAYYRTAAPALAREVQRLQAEVCEARIGHDCAIVAAHESGRRAGQEAMRERAAEVCDTRHQEHWSRVLVAHNGYAHDRAEGMADEADECADAIRALEVEQ